MVLGSPSGSPLGSTPSGPSVSFSSFVCSVGVTILFVIGRTILVTVLGLVLFCFLPAGGGGGTGRVVKVTRVPLFGASSSTPAKELATPTPSSTTCAASEI